MSAAAGGKGGKSGAETKSSSRSSKAGLQCMFLLPTLLSLLPLTFSPRRSYPPIVEEGKLRSADRFRCPRLPRCRPRVYVFILLTSS